MAAGIAVVVVCHNSGQTLHRCVERLLRQPELDELLLVDNDSHDGSLEQLPTDARSRVLRNPDNPGFAQACNQGAAASRSPWLLFLNPDCLLPDGALTRLLAAAQARPEVGLLGAQLLNADGSPQRASRRHTPTPANLLRGRLHACSAAPGEAGVELVDAVSGALMWISRALFERLGGLDPGYRLHCEDLDLCRRVLLSGHRVALLADLQVPHLKGSSSRARPLWVEWQKHRGMWRYYSKFDRADAAPWQSALIALAIALRLPLAAARAYWRARR